MKFHSNTALPYPVIADARDDFVDSSYQVESKVQINNSITKISLIHRVEPYDIEKLVEIEEDFSYAVVIRCRSTFYKQAFFSQQKEQTIKIDTLNLRDEVFIEPYIVARRTTNVISESLNPEYSTDQYLYHSGDVIAKGLERKFSVLKDAFKPLESVFEIVLVDSLKDGDWELDVESDKLSIRASKSVHAFEANNKVTKEGQSVLINSLYYYAVVEAIEILKKDEYSTKWAKVILAKIAPHGIDIKNTPSYKIANILLKLPFKTLIKSFNERQELG